jgi:hypothetical protein
MLLYLFQDTVPVFVWGPGGGGHKKTSAWETSFPTRIKNGYLIIKSNELPLHDSALFRVEYHKKNEKNDGRYPGRYLRYF